jgi:hypothetical protein
MSELFDNINEYIQNSEHIIEGLQKEASDYKRNLDELRSRPFIEKEAAIEVAASLIGKGLISADNLPRTIDKLCADPLGVITELTKTAAHRPVPTMGMGKSVSKAVSPTEDRSKADIALLSAVHLI